MKAVVKIKRTKGMELINVPTPQDRTKRCAYQGHTRFYLRYGRAYIRLDALGTTSFHTTPHNWP